MTGKATHETWRLWDLTGRGVWPELWPPVAYQIESAGRINFRADAPPQAANRLGFVHGAFIAGLGEHLLGLLIEANNQRCVTISLNFDFPAPAALGTALTGTVEAIRETGRLQFVRLELVQGDTVVMFGQGVLRKLA